MATEHQRLIQPLDDGLYRVCTALGQLVDIQTARDGRDGVSVQALLLIARDLVAHNRAVAARSGAVVAASELHLAEAYLGEAHACLLSAYVHTGGQRPGGK